MSRVRASCAVLATLACFSAAPALADGPYEGQWREGPMSIQVEVESWGGDCGPRPQPTSAPGGGTFQVTQSGDQLTFHLRRQRTTRECWSENRAVRQVSSTYQSGTWRIVCRTPPADSRGETGTYTIRAVGEDRLQFNDSSRYDWQLNQSTCRGTITTTQTFSRVGGGPANNDEATAETPETPPAERCEPGAASRVVLRPATAEVPPGGEQCFTTRVVDENGCPLASPRPRLTITEGEGEIEGSCLIASETAGRVVVLSSAGAMSARSEITVHAMDLSDLIARRTETGSVGSGTLVEEDASSETAAGMSARPHEDGPGFLWPSIALAIALLLVLLAVVLLRRRDERRASIPPHLRIARKDVVRASTAEPGTEAEPQPPSAKPESIRPPAPVREQLICPKCRRGYPADQARCPHDDTALVAYKDFAAGKGVEGAASERVCPTCGERYPATVTFCGKDGTTLEAV